MSEKKATTGCSLYRIPEGLMIYAVLSIESFVMRHKLCRITYDSYAFLISESETTNTLNSFQIFISLDRILTNGIGIITLFVK